MFAVLSVASIPNHLRGYISRFLQQVDTSVYVGVVTPRVADGLWSSIVDTSLEGGAVMVTPSSDSETGFEVRSHQTRGFELRDFDGVILPVKVSV